MLELPAHQCLSKTLAHDPLTVLLAVITPVHLSLIRTAMSAASKDPSDNQYVSELWKSQNPLILAIYRPPVRLTWDEEKQLDKHGRWLRRICQPFDSFESILSVWLNSQEGSHRLAQPNTREYYTAL